MALSPASERGADQLVPAAVPSSTRLDCGAEAFVRRWKAPMLWKTGRQPVFLMSGPGRAPAPRRNREAPRRAPRGAAQARRRGGVRVRTVEPTSADARPPGPVLKTETLSLSRSHGQCNWPQISESVAR
jgi:hypothetical protein